ncbi:MAG TPA: hypothetical protein IAC66_06000 [Candidatus Aphodousia gallistercoris]|nr:hypothetical protein [Candidatus Aphodousia gallistercoris]
MSFLQWLHLTEEGQYVLMAFALMAVLCLYEIFSLKARRFRAYSTLLREARARLSEMHLRVD